jgi:hypothetical protein
MSNIYGQAAEVLVFLGDDLQASRRDPASRAPRPVLAFKGGSTDEPLMLPTLARWSSAAQQQRSVQSIDIFCLVKLLSQPLSPSSRLEVLSSMPRQYITLLFDALRRMLTMRWWSRIWVVQEAIMAKSLTVMYGNVSMPWTALLEAASIHSQRDATDPDFVSRDDLKVFGLFSRILDLDLFRMGWKEHGGGSLLSHLRHFSSREASDNRDKIYALLGLCNANNIVEPDYSLDDREAYIMTTFKVLKMERSLSALSGNLGRKNKQDLPSWVPDWSWTMDEHDHKRVSWASHYNACGDVWRLRFRERTKERYALEPSDDPTLLLGVLEDGPAFIAESMKNRMTGLAASLRASESSEDRLPQVMSSVFTQCKLACPTLVPACDELIELCHPDGKLKSKSFAVTLNPSLGDEVLEGGLRTQGRILVRAVEVMQPLYSASDMDIARETIKIWFERFKDFIPESKDLSRSDLLAFAMTLTSAIKMEVTGPVSISPDEEDILVDWLRDFVLEQAESNTPAVYDTSTILLRDSFTRAMRISTAGRTMFFVSDLAIGTVSGLRIGLGPASMAVGDKIGILPGGMLPFVLRPSATRQRVKPKSASGVFSMVGDCYLHGVMNGELGPLTTCGNLLSAIFNLARQNMQRDWKARVKHISHFLSPTDDSGEWERFLTYRPVDMDAWERIEASLLPIQARRFQAQLDQMRDLVKAWAEFRKCESLEHFDSHAPESIVYLV